MVDITFKVADDKLPKIQSSFKTIYPIPLNEETQQPLFTDADWVKEVIKKFVIQTEKRGREVTAINNAKATITEDGAIFN